MPAKKKSVKKLGKKDMKKTKGGLLASSYQAKLGDVDLRSQKLCSARLPGTGEPG